jgi:hypothetical protein
VSRCIKTGARLLLQPYDCVVACDIYAAGGADDIVVVRFNAASRDFSDAAKKTATHACFIGQDIWYREDLGIIVMNEYHLFPEN